MGYIMSNTEQSIKVKAASPTDADEVYGILMDNLTILIHQCEESEEKRNKITKDVYTDVIIPGIKDTYQKAIEYILWGDCSRPRVSRRNYYGGIRLDRDYTDDEKEDSEDE